jgi:hypothetical protein
MKKMFFLIVVVFAVASLFLITAEATLIDFNNLSNRQIVDTEFQASYGLTISAQNVGGGPHLAVIFDSSLTGTLDPDLQGPLPNTWNSGNLAPSTFLGNLLIIAESGADNGSGFLDRRPDDEGSRPAGSLFFDFDRPIDSFGFDVVDIEGPEEYGQDSGYFATFYLGPTELGRVGFGELIDPISSFYDPTIVYGDNSANMIQPITSSDLGTSPFDRVEINMGGSGGVDNINWTHVPEPSSIILLLSGFFGLLGLKRKFRS